MMFRRPKTEIIDNATQAHLRSAKDWLDAAETKFALAKTRAAQYEALLNADAALPKLATDLCDSNKTERALAALDKKQHRANILASGGAITIAITFAAVMAKIPYSFATLGLSTLFEVSVIAYRDAWPQKNTDTVHPALTRELESMHKTIGAQLDTLERLHPEEILAQKDSIKSNHPEQDDRLRSLYKRAAVRQKSLGDFHSGLTAPIATTGKKLILQPRTPKA